MAGHFEASTSEAWFLHRGFSFSGKLFLPRQVECLCTNVERTGAGVVWHLQISDTGATLSLPDVLCDIPGDAVNTLVGCLVITIFLAATTTTIIGVLKCQQVYVSRWLSQVCRLRQRQ